MKPWEEQGVSRATYFRRKSHEKSHKNEEKSQNSETESQKVSQNETKVSKESQNETKKSQLVSKSHQKSHESHVESQCKYHPEDPDCIDKEHMKELIEGGQEFIPNWYRSGFKCKEEAIQYAIDLVNSSKSIKKASLTSKDSLSKGHKDCRMR